MSQTAWIVVFMMLVLKIPIVYLGFVVWYAIKSEPEPGVDPGEYSIWRPWRRKDGPRPRRGSPHGGPPPRKAAHARRERTRVPA